MPKHLFCKIHLLFFCICLLFWQPFASASKNDLKFNHLSITHGLSQSSIYCQLQDRFGFMWFGTLDGLNKYDGNTFTIYRNNPNDSSSIVDNLVNTIIEDNFGLLWIGTSNGLSIYNPYTEKFLSYRFPPQFQKKYSSNQIHTIFQDQNKQIWIGTEVGIFKVDAQTAKLTHYTVVNQNLNSLSNNAIWSFTEDIQGNIWVGTENGLDLWNRNTQSFSHILLDIFKTENQRNKIIRTLFCDSKGNIWIGSQGGGLFLKKFNDTTFTHFYHKPNIPNSISSNEISAIFEDIYHHIWIGTFNGLNKLNEDQNTFTSYFNNPNDVNSLSNNIIISITEDKSGLLWIGTFGGGINILNQDKEKFTLFQCKPNTKNTLISNVVLAINQDKDSVLWIGTDKGLVSYNAKTDKFEWFQHQNNISNSLSDDIVYAIHIDKSGILWLGTKEGVLNRFEPKTHTFKHFVTNEFYDKSTLHFSIRTIFEDNHGKLCLGTNNGLYHFDKETSRFIIYPICSNNLNNNLPSTVLAIYEDTDFNLWLGTEGNGLCCFNPTKANCLFYNSDPKDINSLSNNNVRAIYEDINHNLWIGTSNGLNQFNKHTKIFKHYTTKEGLPNNLIYAIVGIKSGLWLSTNKGLSFFDFNSNTFKNYNVSDGLQSNEYNQNAYYLSPNGIIYFGGVNGLNAFNPIYIKDNAYIPPVFITDFLYYNKTENANNKTLIKKSLLFDNEINISYKDNVFSFVFSSLHFLSPEKNEYSYKMEGFDKDWIYCGNKRYITYTNLSPGEYTFKVRGSNSDGIWNNKGDSIKIIISPPFWKTKWFYALLIIALLTSIFSFVKYRTAKLKKDKKKLIDMVRERTAEIETQKEDIINKNEELQQQKEEIISQKELLEDTNKELAKINVYLSKLSNQSQNNETAIIIANSEGVIQWVNENFVKLYEYNQADYLSENHYILDRCINEETKLMMQQSINDKSSLVFETINKTSTGEEIWVQTTLLPIEDNNDNLIKIVAIETPTSSFIRNI